jgi:hypothetical protein
MKIVTTLIRETAGFSISPVWTLKVLLVSVSKQKRRRGSEAAKT